MIERHITFQQIREVGVSRSNQWFPMERWSLMEWACAMAGEAGEACNVAKKLSRQDGGFDRKHENITADDLAEECADVFIYLDLLCARAGVDLEQAIIKKFNSVSEKYNFPQRL